MKRILTSLLIAFSFAAIGQTDNNLVPNPSFEETAKDKVKEKGSIELAQPWNSPTTVAADLYMEDAKNDEYSVPNNIYGEEKARTGNKYAGISFFGYRRETRSYLQVELLDTLEAGKEYCMKFHVSMADRAKYAVNNLAMYVNHEKIESESDSPLMQEAQIKNIRNRVFDKQFLWEPICGIYKAKGNETHILIGNFNTDDETTQERLRMSRDFSGRQMETGYYYIDDISVIPVTEENREDCMCAKIAGGALKVEYNTFGTDEDKKASAKTTVIVNSDGSLSSETTQKADENKIEKAENEKPAAVSNAASEKNAVKAYNVNDVVLYFDIKSPKLNPETTGKLDKLVEYLNKNKGTKVEIQGHADLTEDAVPFLGKRRAFEVVKYLTDHGIDREQIPYQSFETTIPVDPSKPAANARVTFMVK